MVRVTSVKVCTGIGIIFCPRVVRPNSEASESSVARFKKLPNLREVMENVYLNLVEFVKLLNNFAAYPRGRSAIWICAAERGGRRERRRGGRP